MWRMRPNALALSPPACSHRGLAHALSVGSSRSLSAARRYLFASLVLIQPACAISGGPADVPAVSHGDPNRVDEILTNLQKRSDGLTDIRCKIRFVEEDRINLSKRTKVGSLLFLITEPNPQFLIHFERTEVDGVLGKQEWYLFDGRWLYEVLERIQQVTKREIARENERVDLFDLERAPFPLPFGQKKESILRSFDVSLAPADPADPPGTDHLICRPKPDSTMAKKYDRLEFFVRKDIHLPSRVVATKNGGLEVNTADFPDLSAGSINAGVKKGDLAPQAAWRKYKEVVEELREE